jgi:hypothetical protein
LLSFKDEINKYKPILEIGEIEASVNNNDVKDIMDVISYLALQLENNSRYAPARSKGTEESLASDKE